MLQCLGSLLCTIISYLNSFTLISLLICKPLISVSCLIALVRTSSTIVNSYGEVGSHILSLILVKLLCVSLHLIWCWLLPRLILLLLYFMYAPCWCFPLLMCGSWYVILVTFPLQMWLLLHLVTDVQKWDVLLVGFSFVEYKVSFSISFDKFLLYLSFIRSYFMGLFAWKTFI